jgi:hypothetical protein
VGAVESGVVESCRVEGARVHIVPGEWQNKGYQSVSASAHTSLSYRCVSDWE